MNPLALFVADCVVKATVLLTLAWAATRALRRSSAATRHLIWLVAYVAILALPLAEAMVPGRLILALPAIRQSILASPPKAGSVALNSPVAKPATTSTAARVALNEREVPIPIPARGAASPETKTTPITVLAALWALGAALIALRWLIGVTWTQANRVGIGSPQLGSLAEIVGVRREVRVRMARGSSPGYALTYGVLRPIILLPRTVGAWPPQRLRSVLLHELAHVRRLDWLWQSLASLVCALHWFNPLAWLGIRALRAEAEAATDDLVLSLGCPPSTYARDLLEVAAELCHRHPLTPTTGVTVMKSPQIENRIQAILDQTRNRRGTTTLETLWVGALALAALTPLSMAKLGPSGPSKPVAKTETASHHPKNSTVHVIKSGAVVIVQVGENRYRILNRHYGKVKIIKTGGQKVLQVGSHRYHLVEGSQGPRILRDDIELVYTDRAQKQAMKAQMQAVGAEVKDEAAQERSADAQLNIKVLARAEADAKWNQNKAIELSIDRVKLEQARAEYKEAAAQKARGDQLYREGSTPSQNLADQKKKAEIDLAVKTKELVLLEDANAKVLTDSLSVVTKDSIDAKAGPSPEAEAAIKRAQANLATAQADFGKLQKLYEQGSVTKAEVDSAKKDLTIAELNLKIAKLEAKLKS